MKTKPSIVCTVTNSLNQDQRMHRICTTLEGLGYDVLLIGRTDKTNLPLLDLPFEQKRINVFFQRGMLFYAEYNLKLFLLLLFKKFDIVYSVDLDSLMAGGMIKIIRSKKLVFDAHEYFTETPELIQKPFVRLVWSIIAKLFVGKADVCLTVNESLSLLFKDLYQRNFKVIYNCPRIDQKIAKSNFESTRYILYQGVLNQGRGLESLIKAMRIVDNVELYIIGEGDLSAELKLLADASGVTHKIKFLGWLSPNEIKLHTTSAILGLNLLDRKSQSYRYSLANKFFDYMHAEVPSINMDFPEYQKIIEEYKIGVMIEDLDPITIAKSLNEVLSDQKLRDVIKQNCKLAKQKYHWELEEKKLEIIFNNLAS